MTKPTKFSFPVSPLVGSSYGNFIKVSRNKKIDPGYKSRYFLTNIASLILDPFGKGETLIKKDLINEFIFGIYRFNR